MAAKRIDEIGTRVVVCYRTTKGERVLLNMTRFEKGHLFTRANMLRERYKHIMLPCFRLRLEEFERNLIATYAVPDPFWC